MPVLRLTLRQLQIFAAVAGCGSTTAASGQLALSQSATSSAINELERLLSLSLFDRTGKRLLLNDNGRALLPRAQALLDGAIAIEQSANGGVAQTLRIGASTTIGNNVLPPLLRQFLQQQQMQNSAWQSHVVIGNTEAICDAVATFDLDMGLIEGPSHQPALTMTPWLQDELLLVCAPDYPGTISLKDAKTSATGSAVMSLDALREAAHARAPTSCCCRTCTLIVAVWFWAAHKPSSWPLPRDWVWPACRIGWWLTSLRPGGCRWCPARCPP